MIQNLTILDILALTIVLVSVVIAFSKGLTVELISLLATVCGVVLAFFFYTDAANLLRQAGLPGVAADFLGFVLVFTVTLVIGWAISLAVDRSLKHLYLKWVDRLLGAAFGLVRGFIIAMVIFVALTAFQVRQDLLAKSQLAEFFLTGARAATVVAPPDFRERFAVGYAWVYDLWVRETAEGDE